MRKTFVILITAVACLLTTLTSCENKEEPDAPHIVFVVGDEEYRSEESMPMIAGLLNRALDCRITICYPLDSAGFVDPNRLDHIDGLDALEDADLMVLFTRFRALPAEELKWITDYADSGKPMAGFRTSTHAFLYREDSLKRHMNDQWPTRVFGQQWITHHGHFDDGQNPLTSVSLVEGKEDHAILRGVEPFDAYSWLYHVDGGEWKLYGDSDPLLLGKSLKSGHEMRGNLDKYPLVNPVAWVKSHKASDQVAAARVFFSTLGHPYDFKDANMRRLAVHGILWALGKEAVIPAEGIDVELIEPYEPNNSGFGDRYKKNLQPRQVGD